MQKSLLIAIISFATAIYGNAANASQLWGGRSWLNHIDALSGAILSQSTSTLPFVLSDAASDPVRNPSQIWGIRGFTTTAKELVAIDPARDRLLTTIVYDAPQPIGGLAIDPTTGQFYGTSADSLYRIDPSNGSTTLVGVTGLGVAKALAFDKSGILYGIASSNQLVTVDTTTGLATHVATLDLFRIEDLAARPEDGVMFALGFTTESYQLLTIDTSTGAVELVGPSVVRPTYLAFTGVPEPNAICMLGAGALWLAFGLRREIY